VIGRRPSPILLLALVLSGSARPALADDAPRAGRQQGRSSHDTLRFLAGGALGLGIHESGHALFGLAFDAHPSVKGISFGHIPFFAITHDPVSPGREYAVATAGFWMQYIASEWLLTKRPDLRREPAPVAKGLLAFHVLASAVYGVAALTGVGPVERDTKSMAAALQVKEGWVGVMLLTPAALDTWRYAHPEAAWPRWASRAAKVGTVLLVFRATR
jgi:hypothetical protein